MKNIAILVPDLSADGAARVASEISMFFEEEGHQVYIFTERHRTTYKFAGQTILIKLPVRTKTVIGDFCTLVSLAKEIKLNKKKYNIDVAISFMEQYNIANVLSKGKERVITRICTILSERGDMKGLYYNKFLLNAIYNRADKVIVLSKYGLRDMVLNYGVKKARLQVIPNFVVQRVVTESAEWEYGDNVILSVNRIHPIKQPEILIDVVTQLKQRIPDVRVLFVGNDRNAYASKLKKLVKKMGLQEQIVFVGHVDNVEYYMRHSRVFVMTSAVEGFPNVMIEAMNQGMPIVSTDFKGPVREILGVSASLGSGHYGIVVPSINAGEKDKKYYAGIEQLRNMLEGILTDEKLEMHYRKVAKKRAEFYSKCRVESMWRKVIENDKAQVKKM